MRGDVRSSTRIEAHAFKFETSCHVVPVKLPTQAVSCALPELMLRSRYTGGALSFGCLWTLPLLLPGSPTGRTWSLIDSELMII